MSTITTSAKRVVSIDILRGIIMIVMALDHARDYFSNYRRYDPLDLEHVNILLFFTRWITHFCAPVFVFLAGTSAFLSLSKGRTKKETSWLLFTRGLWLILLEVTIVRFGWTFNVDYHLVVFQVIWAIGWSMLFLSILIFLPMPYITVVGLIIVFGHNCLDSIHAKNFGTNAGYWNFLHEQALVHFNTAYNGFFIYPIIPWIGVMALGYCFGTIFKKEEKERNKWLYSIGFSAIALFIILRWLNIYGDPHPWAVQANGTTLLSFLKCEKYPPSLLYLLMTLGATITLLPIFEKMPGKFGRIVTVYGRVPMFYYILHIYLLHSMALITGLILGVPTTVFTANRALFDPNLQWGFPLGIVYLYWIVAVILLYLPCKWFMKYKQQRKKWWLSYL